MSFFSGRSSDVSELGESHRQKPEVSTLCYLAVPVFIVLAYRAWTNRPPQALADWKSRFGVTSMLVTSAGWCSIVIFIIAANSNLRWARSIANNWADHNYLPLTALLAAFLAFALSGRARIYAITASLSIVLCWWTSWVE